MNKQPTALRLADALDAHQFDEPHAAAAELRRLYEERTAADGVINDLVAKVRRLHAQRDALLEALKKIAFIEDQMYGNDWEEIEEARVIARAAIKAAEENA